MPGIEIGSHINEWNLDAPELFDVFQACADLDMCVFVHPWDMMGKDRMEKYWLPWLVGMHGEVLAPVLCQISADTLRRADQAAPVRLSNPDRLETSRAGGRRARHEHARQASVVRSGTARQPAS